MVHPALARFAILQEVQTGGDRTLLAKSKAGSLVAIRILAETTIPEDIGSALAHESSAGARLAHEAIVQLRAMLIEPDLAALVMEFVPGVSLQRLLRFSQGRGVRVPDNAGWYVVERIFAALAHAHASKDATGAPAPVLHRELSPSSVVIGWNGAVKVGDFGLTRLHALVAALQKKTFVPDAAPLVSPEQARGEDPTARSDVYAAALVAVRLLTGRTPFARYRNDPAELDKALRAGKLHPLSKMREDLPSDVKQAFDRALDPDPAARTVTAQEIVDLVRASFDVDRGKEKLEKLVGRWREELEKTLTPWERRGSLADSGEVGDVAKPAPGPDAGGDDGALALASHDDRPSSDSVFSHDKASEAALEATDVAVSMSRIGSIAPEALQVALPPMRITMPSLPVYGGPVAYAPRPKESAFKGPLAAVLVVIVFVILGGGAFLLFKYLSAPVAPPVGGLDRPEPGAIVITRGPPTAPKVHPRSA
ncbi:MAG: serine/threonine protein kinase [Myxococcales bacterium]|nr:serine/threonine protein kinase [Myxococcales bacterium]